MNIKSLLMARKLGSNFGDGTFLHTKLIAKKLGGGSGGGSGGSSSGGNISGDGSDGNPYVVTMPVTILASVSVTV